jgi:uncharacterized protein (UPF0261 family)
MEALVAEGQVSVVCDITTTEIADEIVGGVLSAGAQRLDVFSRINVPYLGGRSVRCGKFWRSRQYASKLG